MCWEGSRCLVFDLWNSYSLFLVLWVMKLVNLLLLRLFIVLSSD